VPKINLKKAAGIAALVVLASALGYRLFLHRPPAAVIEVKKTTVQGRVFGPGTVQSKVPVTVSTKITGILEKLYADQGDRVSRGQLLAELDAQELKSRLHTAQAGGHRARRELARAQADLAKARANLGLAESNYRRDLEVHNQGYISPAAFDTTKAALQVAEGEVAATRAALAAQEAAINQAQAEIQAAEAQHGYTRIMAPMDGLITVRQAEVGNTVVPGGPIFQMVDLGEIWVAAWIDQVQLDQVRPGQPARIRLRSGRVFQGEVARLNQEADTVTRELEVNVRFAKLPEPLVIGEEAEVTIITGQEEAPAVPLGVVLHRDGHAGVLVVAAGRAEFRRITLGFQDDKKAAVPEGLQAGELVILNPAQIKPGQKVNPVVKSDPDRG
jgi:HlyD family secretion protein